MKRFLQRLVNWVLDHSLWLAAIACAYMIGWAVGSCGMAVYVYSLLVTLL